MGNTIEKEQWQEAAKALGTGIPELKAIYKVEANGAGYLDDGSVKGKLDPEDRVKILFEGHRFWLQIVAAKKDPAAFVKKNPKYRSVLYKDWTKEHYEGGSAEWERMSLAIEACTEFGIPPEAAFDSASYGAFQIMGENAEACGYKSAHEMLTEYNKGGEYEQLMSAVRFIKSKRLHIPLQTHNWAMFAKGYNGSAYRKNEYDIKLANAYNQLKKAA